MTFPRTRPAGFWTLGSTMLPAELEAIDDYSYAIDSRGGVYAPATPIVIGGAGLSVTGPFSVGSTIAIASVSITRVEAGVIGADPTEWGVTQEGSFVTIVNTAAFLMIGLTPPHGSTLTSVEVRVGGAGGHAALPANMPTLAVFKMDVTTGTSSQIGATATDASATVLAYQDGHSITVGGLAEVIDRSINRYYAVLTSEFGANALSGFGYGGCRRTMTVTSIDSAY